MKTLPILLLTAILSFSGCATAHKMNDLSVGMSKPGVILALGRPNSSAAPGDGVEILRYNLYTTSDAALRDQDEEFFVKLVDGKVESYGKMGDFGSTAKELERIQLEIHDN